MADLKQRNIVDLKQGKIVDKHGRLKTRKDSRQTWQT